MNARHRKCIAVALTTGVALVLASTAASAQGENQATSRWQQNWQQYGTPYYPWGGPYYMGGAYLPAPWFGPDLAGMWRQSGAGWGGTSSNLQDMGDYYRFQMSLPGVNPNDLNMWVDGRVLSVSVHSQTAQVGNDGGQWRSSFNNYQQVFTLPQAVDSGRMQSHFENGVLTVNLPKLPGVN